MRESEKAHTSILFYSFLFIEIISVSQSLLPIKMNKDVRVKQGFKYRL